MWAILAFAKSGAGDKAHDLFALLNPISTPETERYKVEPYVVAADVYSVAPHVGRGGWTWYTGSAAWMYRSGVEGILGIRREGAFLIVNPCIPRLGRGLKPPYGWMQPTTISAWIIRHDAVQVHGPLLWTANLFSAPECACVCHWTDADTAWLSVSSEGREGSSGALACKTKTLVAAGEVI